MTFVLRQVSRRVSGAEIVREKVLTAAEPRVGRGTDCDIRLPDLAVSLHHATLRIVSPGRVLIEAAGREPFGLDDRFVRRAEVNVADGPRLVFGDHVLTLSPGEGGRTLINLAVSEAATADAAKSGATDVIPPAKVFGRRRMAWGVGLTIVALCLIWPLSAFYGHINARIDADQQWSSGPLSTAHTFLEDDCQACHQEAFVAVKDSSCMSCHSGARPVAAMQTAAREARAAGSPDDPSFVRDHAPRRRILWGTPPADHFGGEAAAWFRRTFNLPEQRCASCHTEHVANPIAGQPPEPKPTLTSTQTCVQCHTGLSGRLRDTDLVDTPGWPNHPNFRPGLPGPSGVTRISMTPPSTTWGPRENSGLTFPHRLHLSPGGGPARMAQSLGGRGYGAALTCADCHRPEADGKGFGEVQMERDCGACHSLAFATPGGGVRQLPHGHPAQVVAALRSWLGAGGPVARSAPVQRRRPGQVGDGRGAGGQAVGASSVTAVGGAFGRGGACFECHTIFRSPTLGIRPVTLPRTFLSRGAFDHSVKEHRLDRQGQPNCAQCHAASTSDAATDLLLPSVSECAECHGRTEAQTPQAASADCETCHSFHAPSQPTPRERPADHARLAPPPRRPAA